MKRFVISVITVILSLCCVLPAFSAEPSLTVRLRIEGKDKNLFYDQITVEGSNNCNIISILMLADSKSESLSVSGLDYGYITEINGVKTGQTKGGKDSYTVTVNGVRIPFENLKTYPLKNGDSITVYYADNYGADMIFPIIDLNKLEQGYIRFFYEKASDDGKSVTTLPITGANVTWYCDNAPFNYITDQKGGIQIEKNALTSGSHKLSIELKDANGLPMLLRPAPDFTVDVAVEIGDSFAVYACALTALLSLAASLTLLTSLKKDNK